MPFPRLPPYLGTSDLKLLGKQEVQTTDYLGVKIRNLKVDFKTGCTWHRVGQ